MKHLFAVGALIILCSPVFSQVFTDSNLPIVIINTSNGNQIPDNPRVRATMKIIFNGPGVRNFVTEQNEPTKLNYNGTIMIEVRGSSSQSLPKKQYGLTTVMPDLVSNNNVSLLGMPKENDWVLNGLAFDASLIRDYLSYNLSAKLGNYAPRQRYCEMVLNGTYEGLYILQEKVKVDDNRVDIAKLEVKDKTMPALSGGYLIKADKVSGQDISSWTMPTYLSWSQTDFIHESPKLNELTAEQRSYITNVFMGLAQAAGNSSVTNGFPSIIDVPSFLDFMIINELASNVDAYQFSTYFHKERQGKLRAGPLWDLNLTYGNDLVFWGLDRSKSDVWQFDNGDNIGPKFWRDLYSNPSFKCNLSKRWSQLTTPGQPLHIDELYSFIDEIVVLISEAAVREQQRWGTVGNHAEKIQEVKSFLEARVAWMTNRLGSFAACANVSTPPLVITRIHYHPEDTEEVAGDDPEFIEIMNTSENPVPLTGIYFSGTGIGFQFATGTTLPGNAVIQITDNKNAFKDKYGYVAYGEFARKLSNATQKITLVDALGNVIDVVEYADKAPWPDADGNGYYLKLSDPALDNNTATNWVAADESIQSTEIILGRNDEAERIEVVPNPTGGMIIITSPGMIEEVILSDIMGKMLQHDFPATFNKELNLKDYPAGIYVLKIQTRHGLVVKKIYRE